LPIEATFAGKPDQRLSPAPARLLRNILVEMREADLAVALHLELAPDGGLDARQVSAHAIHERPLVVREDVAVGDADRIMGMLRRRNDAVGDETIDPVGNVTNDEA
jgi:hypothetical protein